VKLVLLGTGDSFCSDNRGSTSVLVDASTRILLDWPPQIVYALRLNGYFPNDVSHVLISHTHGDHVVGLVFLAESLLYKDKGALEIYGPKGLKNLVYNLYHKLFPRADLHKVLTFLPDLSDLPFTCMKTRGVHSPPDTIYRIEIDGTTVVYTGDTAEVDLSKFAKNADHLIHEAAETNAAVARRLRHSTPTQAASTAKRAAVRNLVIVHSPRLTSKQKREVTRIFPRTIFPADGQIIDVP
jgi:ribonuclease BN (tRNA processing enzyme)